MRVWIADCGETGSEGLGVLDRIGLPAKAWEMEAIVRSELRLSEVLEKRVVIEDDDDDEIEIIVFDFCLCFYSLGIAAVW